MLKYIFLTGASGVGKSTILNFIKNKCIGLTPLEVSARPYLPQGGSYDQTLTDEIQAIIVQNRTLSTIEVLLSGEETIFSRGPIDNLAYQRALNKGTFLDQASKREINIIKNSDQCAFVYIPIEFPMSQNDALRGNNESVQKATDDAIKDIFLEFEISPLYLSGSIEERETKIQEFLQNQGFEFIPF